MEGRKMKKMFRINKSWTTSIYLSHFYSCKYAQFGNHLCISEPNHGTENEHILIIQFKVKLNSLKSMRPKTYLLLE